MRGSVRPMVRATCCPRSPATAIAHRGHPTAIAHSQEIAERLGGLLYPDIQRTNPQEAQIFFDWKDKRFILKSFDPFLYTSYTQVQLFRNRLIEIGRCKKMY